MTAVSFVDGTNGDDLVFGLTGLWGDVFAYDLLSGDDTLLASDGVNVINAGDGNDVIVTSYNADTVDGGNGNDVIAIGNGLDVAYGGNGNDTIVAGQGGGYDFWDNIRAYGGNGNDKLMGANGNDQLMGDAGRDTLKGGNGDDYLNGGASRDHLNGGAGNDYQEGDAGGDQLKGGSGFDTLNGGAGDDTLTGGTGGDTFVWNSYGGDIAGSRDMITDFQAAQGDTFQAYVEDPDAIIWLWDTKAGAVLVIDDYTGRHTTLFAGDTANDVMYSISINGGGGDKGKYAPVEAVVTTDHFDFMM